ncbi:MAG: thioredoxin family protein [Gemmobacter sp.]
MRRLLAAFALIPFLVLPAQAEGLRLLMVEQPGCIYCARWDAEVGDAYALTPEGQAAPLLRHRLRAALPYGVTLTRPAVFTPTFILLDAQGQETGRIEGYPGEDFFWGLLGRLLEDAAVPAPGTTSSG